MGKLWDKRNGESVKAYQAFCDYRDMGTGRSLRSLVEMYIKQLSSKIQASTPTTKESTVFTWSVRNEWQKRVEGWDNHTTGIQTRTKEDAIKELIDNEMNDYNELLKMWKLEFKALPLHLRNHVVSKYNDDTGQLTVTEFEKLTYDAFHQMVKARDDIAKQGRRALGLPDKVTEKHLDIITWQDRAIQDIKDGVIDYEDLEQEFDSELATQLFARAGVPISLPETTE